MEVSHRDTILVIIVMISLECCYGDLSTYNFRGVDFSQPSSSQYRVTPPAVQKASQEPQVVISPSTTVKLEDYKMDNHSIMMDMIPMYVCNGSSDSIDLPEWYGSCKYQCSYSTQKIDWAVKLYMNKEFLGEIDVFGVDVTVQTRQAHESITGYCTIFVTSNMPGQYNASRMQNVRQDLLKNFKTDMGTYSDFGDPDCSYWSDTTSTGTIYRYAKEQWKIKIGIDGNLYVDDVNSATMFLLSDGIGEENGRWFIWSTGTSVDKSTCRFDYFGDDTCEFNPLSGLAYCKITGMIINTNDQVEVKSCDTSLNASSNGIFYQLTERANKLIVKSRINDLLVSQEGVYGSITGLMEALSETLTTLETTYCSSLCDLADRSFQMNTDTEDVVDTANGPWLPQNDRGNISVRPCRVNEGFSLLFPLEVCVSKGMFRVINNVTNEELWWQPELTYIDKESNCTVDDINDFSTQLELKKPISFRFWRGIAVIYYPYSGPVYWTPRINPLSVRSSKWFPRIKAIASGYNFTSEEIASAIVSSLNISTEDRQKHQWEVKTLPNQVVFFAKKVWVDIQLGVMAIIDWVTSPIKLIVTIALILAGALFVKSWMPSRHPRGTAPEWYGM